MYNIYYIGGSPCSGKSTIAELLCKKYDFIYYKVDDYLNEYITQAAKCNDTICAKVIKMSPEEIWMRDPSIQNEEEFQIYREIHPFIHNELCKLANKNNVITEGAAFLPEIIHQLAVPQDHYVCITPTKEFQIYHYRQREWIPYILEGCSNKDEAFMNWMERDALFAEQIRSQCKELGYYSITNDGTHSIDSMLSDICQHYHFEL